MTDFNPALQSRRTGLSWDKEFRPRVDDVRDALRSEGYDLKARGLFLLFLAVGWREKSNPGTPPRATDSARYSELRDEDFALFNAIAMADTGSYDVLASRDDVLDIVEGYAAGGLRKVAELLDSSQSLVTALVSEIWPQIESWKDPEISQEEGN